MRWLLYKVLKSCEEYCLMDNYRIAGKKAEERYGPQDLEIVKICLMLVLTAMHNCTSMENFLSCEIFMVNFFKSMPL